MAVLQQMASKELIGLGVSSASELGEIPKLTKKGNLFIFYAYSIKSID
jgi:hypothetical protein